MSLRDTLDQQMRAQLRSRYRPLPPIAPAIMAQPDDRCAEITAATQITPKMVADTLVRCGVTFIECKAQGAYEGRPMHLTMREMIAVVSAESGVSIADLKSPRRARHLVRPRQVLMWLARKHTPYSLPDVGRAIGNRDHTTVMHSCRVIEGLIKEGQPDIAELIEKCEAEIIELSKKATR